MKLTPFILIAITALSPGFAFAHEGDHGDHSCASEHASIAGQVSNSMGLQALQQPVWGQTSAVVNISAVSRPKVSPVAMMFLDGKIVPAVIVKPLKVDSSAGSDQQN